MTEQFDIFGNAVKPFRKPTNKEKRNWENAFQRWSDKVSQDETNPMGICGFGVMCDYCDDNTKGRPCVRALNKLLRAKETTIDYSKRNFKEIWYGIEV